MIFLRFITVVNFSICRRFVQSSFERMARPSRCHTYFDTRPLFRSSVVSTGRRWSSVTVRSKLGGVVCETVDLSRDYEHGNKNRVCEIGSVTETTAGEANVQFVIEWKDARERTFRKRTVVVTIAVQ